MKLNVYKILVIVLALLGAIGVLLIWNAWKVGRVLDSYKGVPVYDNSLFFFLSYGRHYSNDGYYYGQKWQCVEYVKRFYCDAKGHMMPDVMGHAKSYFDESLPDGALNKRRGLVQFRNGLNEKPCLDDLLVFNDTRYGHVGIVTEVGKDYVEIIQQNVLGHTRQRFLLTESNGQFFIVSPRRPAGWLRKVEVRPQQ
jgi:surface antigen